jgi:pyruvate dehydrogenase E1 component alpha subunit/2-oxoisovalerate dehydrogenase E1 component
MDVLAVEAAAHRAVALIRCGAGPYLLECRTYRFRPHSMFDSELYRTKEEVAEWKQRDPIDLLVNRLRQSGLFGDADMAMLEQEVTQVVENAVAFAEAGSWEAVADLYRFVHSEKGGL